METTRHRSRASSSSPSDFTNSRPCPAAKRELRSTNTFVTLVFCADPVVTNAAKTFADLDHLKNHLGIGVWTDEDEWGHWKENGDPIPHIDLMKWADILLIAPLSANTLAKIAGGFADNLVTCILRAWPVANIAAKPVFVAPAMNTHMWDHPLTTKHLNVLRDELHFHIIPPIPKVLACGDFGNGAMEELVNIAKIIKQGCARLPQTIQPPKTRVEILG